MPPIVLPSLISTPSPACSTSFKRPLINTENNIGDKLHPCAAHQMRRNIPHQVHNTLYISLMTLHISPLTPNSHILANPESITPHRIISFLNIRRMHRSSSLPVIFPVQAHSIHRLYTQFVFTLKPARPSCKTPPLSRCRTNLSLIILQNTFPTTLNKVTPV